MHKIGVQVGRMTRKPGGGSGTTEYHVSDDWPGVLLVTEGEFQLYEAFLSDLFHAMMDIDEQRSEDAA
jgi:hypothetical protein